MSDTTRRNLVSRTAIGGGSRALKFVVRWLVWAVVIGTPAFLAGEWLWPHVYRLWGPPLQMFQSETYQAVLFGDIVSAFIGGGAVAFIQTFRSR